MSLDASEKLAIVTLMNSAGDKTMGKRVAFLFVSEGAVYPIDADEVEAGPPSGVYGEDWVVIRAGSAAEARFNGECVLWENAPAEEHNALAHEFALAEYGI